MSGQQDEWEGPDHSDQPDSLDSTLVMARLLGPDREQANGHHGNGHGREGQRGQLGEPARYLRADPGTGRHRTTRSVAAAGDMRPAPATEEAEPADPRPEAARPAAARRPEAVRPVEPAAAEPERGLPGEPALPGRTAPPGPGPGEPAQSPVTAAPPQPAQPPVTAAPPKPAQPPVTAAPPSARPAQTAAPAAARAVCLAR